MSPYLHYEIARGRQQEMVSRATNSHRSHVTPTTADRYRGLKHRLVRVVAALGVFVAAGTAVTVSDARTNQRPIEQHAGQVSAPQLAGKIRAFEAKGYVPISCTVGGTLMHNYRTRQSVTVKW